MSLLPARMRSSRVSSGEPLSSQAWSQFGVSWSRDCHRGATALAPQEGAETAPRLLALWPVQPHAPGRVGHDEALPPGGELGAGRKVGTVHLVRDRVGVRVKVRVR
eukprot:scaffold30255_cov45-Phaeocystis_antarctica.AAC.5